MSAPSVLISNCSQLSPENVVKGRHHHANNYVYQCIIYYTHPSRVIEDREDQEIFWDPTFWSLIEINSL